MRITQPARSPTEGPNSHTELINVASKKWDNCPRCAVTRAVLKELLRTTARRRAYCCTNCGGLGHSRQTCPD